MSIFKEAVLVGRERANTSLLSSHRDLKCDFHFSEEETLSFIPDEVISEAHRNLMEMNPEVYIVGKDDTKKRLGSIVGKENVEHVLSFYVKDQGIKISGGVFGPVKFLAIADDPYNISIFAAFREGLVRHEIFLKTQNTFIKEILFLKSQEVRNEENLAFEVQEVKELVAA